MPFTGDMTPTCKNRLLKTTIIPGEPSLRIQSPIVFIKKQHLGNISMFCQMFVMSYDAIFDNIYDPFRQ